MSGFAVLGELVKDRRPPYDAMLQITERCNFRCTHCYQTHLESDVVGAGPDSELSLAEIEGIFDQLVEIGILFLTLSGGEVFVRRDWPEILKAAHTRAFATTLFTTGYHLDEKKADFLAECGVHEVDLSLYGSHAKLHEMITDMPSSFERTVRAARLLRARDIRVKLKAVLFRENSGDVAALKALSDEIGCEFSITPIVTVTDTGETSPLAHRVDDETLAEFYRLRFDQLGGHSVTEKPLTEAPCGAGHQSLRIDSRGRVYTCAALTHVAGDLRKQSVAEIWWGSSYFKRMRSVTWGDLPVCRDCQLRQFCSRCHADADLEDGDMFGPSLESCRNAVALRDVLRERGVVSELHRALPPPLSGKWSSRPAHEGRKLRVLR